MWMELSKFARSVLLVRSARMVHRCVKSVERGSTQIKRSKLPVALLVAQASTVIKTFNMLKVLVKVVSQENTLQRKVLQVALVAMIAHQASIQQRLLTTTMKRSALSVLQTRTVRSKEEILHVTAVPMAQRRCKV